MSTISNKDIAKAIYLTCKDKNQTEQSLFFKKVIDFLVRKRKLVKTKEILFYLNKIINETEGRVEVKVSSRKSLSEGIQKELKQSLTKRYSAKEISFIENLDEKLLGGFKVEIGDEVIDLTVRNKINKLQAYLTS